MVFSVSQPVCEPACDAYVQALDKLSGWFQGVAPGSCSNGQDLYRDDDAKQRALPAAEVMSGEV